MRIYKFGGASVKDAESVKNIANIIKNVDDNLVIVISAMGKTTNTLENVLSLFLNNENHNAELVKLKKYHNKIAEELFPDNHKIFNFLETIFNNLQSNFTTNNKENYDKLYDSVVSYGEILSTRIVSCYLNLSTKSNRWVDIREVFKTDNNFREGIVDFDKSQTNVLNSFRFQDINTYVTQGFIASTKDDETTTLGREGSDYSASLLGYFLDAESVTIWKDVAGVLNADPRVFCNTVKLDEISYQEAIELAYFGAQVIHPKTIKPLENKRIPLFVKSFIDYKSEGTIIKKLEKNIDLVPIFIIKENQVLISISPKDFSFIVEENLSKIFGMLAEFKIKVNLFQHSAISISFSIDNDSAKTPKLIKKLQQNYLVKYNSNLELLSIRHFTEEVISEMISNKKVYIEQKSRNTARFVLG